jgi:hypothetical protein
MNVAYDSRRETALGFAEGSHGGSAVRALTSELAASLSARAQNERKGKRIYRLNVNMIKIRASSG